MPVDLRLEMHEHRAQPNRRPVHQHELAWGLDAVDAAQLAMHFGDHLIAEFAGVGLLNRAHPVLHQRLIEEARPVIEDLDHFLVDVAEPPALIGVYRQFLVIVAKRVIKVDDSLHEGRRENPDASEIKQVQIAVGAHRVVAKMWVPVNHAVMIKWDVPGAEHIQGDGVAQLQGIRPVGQIGDERQQRLAFQPAHGDQPVGRQVIVNLWQMGVGLAGEHVLVERQMAGFAPIIQFLAQAGRKLGVDLFGRNRFVVALIDRKNQLQLA